MKGVKKVSYKLQDPIIKPAPDRFRNNNQISITDLSNAMRIICFSIFDIGD
jgi:hypothetical protein